MSLCPFVSFQLRFVTYLLTYPHINYISESLQYVHNVNKHHTSHRSGI